MLHALGSNCMTQEVPYLRGILSAQVEADNAHMHIRGESL